ncbi:suppressor of fused domain protein [Corynebacterium lubricantis]|uniref:suppressor of fused domain protein n=1 Tax=Corynebacterium lubricantis TaxID=541095 RepID=UPI0003608767|nr:suppressor of fused domain protein [Corynebacterium lubricantis]
MTGEEKAVWLSNVYGEIALQDIEGRRIAFATLNDDYRIANTVGFSDVDTGLVMQTAPSIEVRCELAVGSSQATDAELAAAAVGAWNFLESGNYTVQPGTLLPDFVQQTALKELKDITVEHGVLREPTWFPQGTPNYSEPGRVTLMLELVLLTNDEYVIASERGIDKLDTRLRRRRTDVGDLRRDRDAD